MNLNLNCHTRRMRNKIQHG